MSDARTILIFGAGYSGRAYARVMAGETEAMYGTTRSLAKAGELVDAGVTPLLFDGIVRPPDVLAALRRATDLVISIAPGETGDPVLRLFADDIAAAPKLRHITYLSTVGVYGDQDGAWVDEDTPCRPVSKRSTERVEAEQDWLSLGARSGKPLAILRLSGIYGPGRNALVNLANGTARRLVKPGQVFNRIHVDDIAGALRFLAGRGLEGIFNVTDNEPAPPQDVVTFAAGLMGVTPPPEQPFGTAELSPMARSFYGENKRVSNEKLHALGYEFRHPDYRSAFERMWRDDCWR
ncbi:MAG TPA: SDR family NAD(P)-dependent oxidoreductase [Rhizobiaceae bacterium]|nr:SDR family NAD(P)-dependent oxidoreductase [Rhizobiaceae bacterium]